MVSCLSDLKFFSFFKIFLKIFIFRERGKEGEREGEKHQCVFASHMPHPGYLAGNPGMCPDWELNLQPFGSQASTQSTEAHQPRQKSLSKNSELVYNNVIASHVSIIPFESVISVKNIYFTEIIYWKKNK